MVIFRFRGYFGNFLSFRDILVIFRFRGYFGHFLGFGGYFGHFVGFGGVFWSFLGGDILVIFWVLGVFW